MSYKLSCLRFPTSNRQSLSCDNSLDHKREDVYQNFSVLYHVQMSAVLAVCTIIRAVFTRKLRPVGLVFLCRRVCFE